MFQLLAGALALALAFGGWQYHRVTVLTQELETAETRLDGCARDIQLILEGEAIDNEIPDDLRDFVPPASWFLPRE